MPDPSPPPLNGTHWPRRPWYRRLLNPPGLWRADRWLVTRYPLVWRSRILFFLLGSTLAANVALHWAGGVYPVAADALPTVDDVANIMTVLYGVGAAALLIWGYLQYRSPLHEMSLRRYGLLTALYAACTFSVLVNPTFFIGPLVNRMAEVVPKEQFRADYAFHEANGFWICNPDLTERSVAERRGEIEAALARYGVGPDFWYSEDSWVSGGYPCGGDLPVAMPSLMTGDDPSVPIRSLVNTLESLREAKAFAADGTGEYAHYVHHLSRLALLSGVLGVLLTVLVCYRDVWRRIFDPYGNRFSLPRPDPPLPGFMRRLDDRLIASHPLLWSTRAHTFAYWAAVLGVGAIVAVLVSLSVFVDDPSELVDDLMERVGEVAGLIVLLGVGVVLSGAWGLYQRRIDLRFRTTSENQRVLLLYLIITSVLPLLAVGVMALVFGDPTTLAGFAAFFLLGAWLVTSLVYVSKHASGRDVALSFLVTMGALVGIILVLSLMDEDVGGPAALALVSAWLILGVVLHTRHRRRIGYLARLGAAVFIMSIPVVLLAALIGTMFLLDVASGASENLTIGLFLLLSIPTYAFLTIPATRILLRCRYWPRVE